MLYFCRHLVAIAALTLVSILSLLLYLCGSAFHKGYLIAPYSVERDHDPLSFFGCIQDHF